MTGGGTIPIDWDVFGPAIVMTAGALLALVGDLLTKARGWSLSWAPMVLGAVATIGLILRDGGDGLWFGFSLVIAVGTLLIALAASVLRLENAMPAGEFNFLIGSAAAGGLVMVGASDVVSLVVGIELLALPSIALVGLRQGDRRAIASAWTFFLTSVVSTAIMLTGIALLYGLTGSLQYDELARRLDAAPSAALTVGVVLTVVGLLFKLGAVPFHAWVPDAYRSASPMVAGFLASVSKAASLGALVLLLHTALRTVSDVWIPVVALVAAATMTIGNLGALRQREGIAVLAWSSVAQAGFLLAPVVASWAGVAALRYVAVYALANVVAFGALAVVTKVRGTTDYAELAGLARTEPLLGVPLAFAVLTLAGFPPAVIGLLAKYVVFQPVVERGLIWLAVVMAINVMLGLAYYLRLVAVLFAAPETARAPTNFRLATTVVVLGAAALVALSAWPSALFELFPAIIDN